MIPVTDLDSALAAVGEIIEQGEGAQGHWKDAHYGRFLSVREELDALRQADPTFEPARPVLGAFLRQPFDIPTPRPVITDPQAGTRSAISPLLSRTPPNWPEPSPSR